MIFGVDYYPEHWPRHRWEIDARMMRFSGLDVVRIAEFAWSTMEPRPDQFEFEWLDQAIGVLQAAGLQIILGTPTAAPPAWLTRAYPETLPVDENGRRRDFGGRRHYCANSSIYQERTRKIIEAMALRYGREPAVIGWQIDNEFGGGRSARCYCPICAAAFRVWLQARYGNIEALNEAWGTVFWSQSYHDWSQVSPPALTVEQPNPSQVLDYYRFASDSWVAYQQLQFDLLKKICDARQFVTHNFMGLFHDLDYHKLAAPLDFVTWDSYPSGHLERWRPLVYPPDSPSTPIESAYAYDLGEPVITQLGHDLTRGLKQAPFWVMEQQCGHINWGAYNPGIRPGAVRLWTWHAVASGANGMIYFRWRACRYAQEQYHSGLLHHDGTPDVGLEDVGVLQQERALLDEIADQPYESQVAILLDYNDLWAVQIQPHRQNFSYLRHLFLYYQALLKLGIQVDVLSPQAELHPYKMVISPTAILGDSRLAARLMEFADQGGELLLGVRSGFNSSTKVVVDTPLPGLFHDLVGATVKSWHSLPPGVGYNLASEIPGLSGQATVWAEALEPGASAQPLVTYRGGPFVGMAALSEHKIGWGSVYYCGIYPDPAQALGLIRFLAGRAEIPSIPVLPESILAIRRGSFLVLLNFSDDPHAVEYQGRTISVNGRDVQIVRSDFPS